MKQEITDFIIDYAAKKDEGGSFRIFGAPRWFDSVMQPCRNMLR